jgi:RimJ/RimL family protein N-acetyltransferase
VNRIIYIQNDLISLVQYLSCDSDSLYLNWLDTETQDGFNFKFAETFDVFFCRGELKQRFFAMVKRNSDGILIGSVGISPPNTVPDLAISVFRPFRKQGYGTAAFALATKYAISELHIDKLHAGAYSSNIGSLKMLERCGYVAYPEGNTRERHYLTGEDIVQLDFVFQNDSL